MSNNAAPPSAAALAEDIARVLLPHGSEGVRRLYLASLLKEFAAAIVAESGPRAG